MSAGHLLLLIAGILVFSGLLQRVLDRMYMSDRQALCLIGLMFLGGFLPEFRVGNVNVNIGGALIPLGVCVYLIVKADTSKERLRSVIGSFITGVLIFAATKALPSEAEKLLIDPLWLYGLIGGIVAWLIGRSRRGAFICGVVGILIADVLSFMITAMQGYQAELHLGGGGIADASVISGMTAVLLCETFGELIERMIMRKRGDQA